MRTRGRPEEDEAAAGYGSCAFTVLGTVAVAVALVWYIFNDPLAMAELEASPASFWWGMLVGGGTLLALTAAGLHVVTLVFLQGVKLARKIHERRNAGAAPRSASGAPTLGVPRWKPWALATLLSVGVLVAIFALWGDTTGEEGTAAGFAAFGFTTLVCIAVVTTGLGQLCLAFWQEGGGEGPG